MTSTTTPARRATARRVKPSHSALASAGTSLTTGGNRPRVQPLTAAAGLVVVTLVGLVLTPLPGWTSGELRVVQWFSAHHAPALDAAAGLIGTVVSPPVGFVLLLVTCAVVARWIGSRRAVVLLGIAGATLAGGMVLKVLVHRSRPDVALLVSPPPVDTSSGYPSGHTTVATVLVLVALTVLPRRHRAWTVPAGVVLVAAVAASRVYLGLHYPLDVLAAAVYAVCAFAFLSALVTTRPVRRLLSVVHLDAADATTPSDQPPVLPEGEHA